MPDLYTDQYDERSRLVNGRFLHNLNAWTPTSASYSAGDGDEHYGVANISVGGSIAQVFAVERARQYTLHLSVKAPSGTLSASQATVTLVDGSGSAVLTQNLSGGASGWTDNEFTFGLAPGASYTLTIANATAAGAIRVDDVWLWYVPITRANLAARVARKLSALATDAGLDTTSSGLLTEGHYTDAVDAGLRSVGAVDPETDLPDVRYLDSASVDSCADAVEREMLERLGRYYATLTDIKVGPRDEKLSQIRQAIEKMTSAPASGGAKVVVRKLAHQANDFNLG